MKRVIARAPVRADLAGGTLDLWPIYLFHPGSRTVHVAVSFYAESEITEIGGSAIEIHLTDQNYTQRYESLLELSKDDKAALIYRVLEHFHIDGIRIVTRTDAPRGSGLGGSSALAVTLVRALSELAAQPFEGESLVNLVRDLETRLLGVPAGIQDYYPAVFGGLGCLHLEPGLPRRVPISIPLAELAQRFVLHYSEVSHFSGTNNWEMYKRQIDGMKKVHKGFDRIAEAATQMEHALETSDWAGAGKALAAEWKARNALIDGISTPEIDEAIKSAVEAGAWGGKACGAGGGGCIVFLFPPEKREAVIEALEKSPGRVLQASPVPHGLTIEVTDDTQATFSFVPRRRIARASDEPIEQLYVHGGSGEYKPHVLAEGVITHSEGRSGVHHSVMRAVIAPVASSDGNVLWHQARTIDPDSLDLRAGGDPAVRPSSISPDVLLAAALHAQEGFRQYLEENERLLIFHNPAFGFYSEPNETRESFLDRCAEETARRIEDEAERLEGTFRRRIDQLREKSEREQREIEAKDEEAGNGPTNEVNVAWGQALYNITSGRPAAVAEATHSAREVDYLENIAQVQRAWEKELDAIRDDLTSKARSIEEITLTASSKNIEIAKYVLLWIPS